MLFITNQIHRHGTERNRPQKNFANFKTLNTFIIGMDKDCQPANPLATLSNVQSIITKGDTIMENIREVTFPYPPSTSMATPK